MSQYRKQTAFLRPTRHNDRPTIASPQQPGTMIDRQSSLSTATGVVAFIAVLNQHRTNSRLEKRTLFIRLIPSHQQIQECQ
jgi:hypothetical protein